MLPRKLILKIISICVWESKSQIRIWGNYWNISKFWEYYNFSDIRLWYASKELHTWNFSVQWGKYNSSKFELSIKFLVRSKWRILYIIVKYIFCKNWIIYFILLKFCENCIILLKYIKYVIWMLNTNLTRIELFYSNNNKSNLSINCKVLLK